MARVLLLDTHSLLYRAFFALPPMTTSHGQPTAALYGLSTMLLKVLREDRPLGLAFALDTPEPTFRQARSPSYKAQRPAMAAELRQQLEHLPRLLRAFAVPCFAVPTFEADDVLATLAKQVENDGHVSRIVTGDRDLFQVVRDRVDVMFVGARGQPPVVYDLEAIERRYGLRPEQLPSRTALVGDASDNLPKVKGIGERGAGALVRNFGDARNLLAQVQHVTPARLRESIERSADQILATEALARLVDDVPLPAGPRYSAVGPAALLHVRELFIELEFKSLLPRLDALLNAS
ncbi:MAG: 5'-3' exonuclease H3TH domain-containing protein [Polyangiales bacterium]